MIGMNLIRVSFPQLLPRSSEAFRSAYQISAYQNLELDFPVAFQGQPRIPRIPMGFAMAQAIRRMCRTPSLLSQRTINSSYHESRTQELRRASEFV